jgi:hypothetical protein
LCAEAAGAPPKGGGLLSIVRVLQAEVDPNFLPILPLLAAIYARGKANSIV